MYTDSLFKYSMKHYSNDIFAENGKLSRKKASVSTSKECYRGAQYIFTIKKERNNQTNKNPKQRRKNKVEKKQISEEKGKLKNLLIWK